MKVDIEVVESLLKPENQEVSKVRRNCGLEGSGLMLPLWEEVLWPFLDAWDSVRLRTASTQRNVPGRYGPYGELFFLPFEERAEGLQ